MMQTLQWVFTNFPNPSHIVLTGCSAGAAALPVVYAIIHEHYTSISTLGLRSVQISVLADSPVYLTPPYFLENGYDNWNPSTIMKQIGFPYETARNSTDYSTYVWDSVLTQGSEFDKWGIISHTYDPTAIAYFGAMSGYQYEENDNDIETQWWNEFLDSLNIIQSHHINMKTFFIDGIGHCSFGLYYALQSDGFVDWATSILYESPVLGKFGFSFVIFVTSLFLGASLGAGIFFAGKKRKYIELDEVVLLNNHMENTSMSSIRIDSLLSCFKSSPITTIYSFITTFYFFSMLYIGGFEHPIYNPSLGPSAVTLSSFGINNPTLIVYNHEYWRLIISAFVCSGIITYLIVVFCLWKYIRHTEARLNNTFAFFVACSSVLIGSNLVYSCSTNGASCSSVAFILGLNAFSISITKKKPIGDYDNDTFPSPWKTTLSLLLFTCIFFSFNNWIILVGAIIIGGLVSPFLFLFKDTSSTEFGEIEKTEKGTNERMTHLAKKPLTILVMIYIIMFGTLLLRIIKPDVNYKYPYLTGCELVYSTNLSDLNGNHVGEENNKRRYLVEGQNASFDSNDQNMCAQLCVPHIAYLPILWGFNKYTTIAVEHGLCEENGYDAHIADKTFREFSITLDVELYYKSDYKQ